MAKKQIGYDDFIQRGSLKEFITDIEKLKSTFDSADKSLIEFAKNTKNLTMPSVGASNFDSFNKSINDVNQSYEAQLKIKKQLADLELKNQRVKEVEERRARNIAKEQERLAKAQSKATRDLGGAYDEANRKANELYKTLRNLEYEGKNNTATFKQLKDEYDQINAKLVETDASFGRHQRNVGNYASGWNGLGNAINQLSREMPAFTYSIQTGFMAISNNLPILIDEINKLRTANVNLRAEGKPTTSVFKQITGALFSWQTALSVGITLLTVYGKEIGNWVSSLWGSSDALKELNERQKEFNDARVQGSKDAQAEILELQKNLAVATDTKLNMDLRTQALKNLRSQYYYYFKDLTDAQILEGKYNGQVVKLNQALEKRKALEKQTEISVKNKQIRIELENEIDALNTQIPLLKETLDLRREQAKGDRQFSGALANAQNAYNKALKERKNLTTELKELNKNEKENEKEIIRLKKETIELEIQEEKTKSSRASKQKEIVDYTRQERDIYVNMLDDEYRKRAEVAYNTMLDNIADIKEEGIKAKEYAIALENQYLNELQKIYQDRYKAIWKEREEEEKRLREAHEKEIQERMDFYNEYLEVYNSNKTLSKLSEYYNKRQAIIDNANMTSKQKQEAFEKLDTELRRNELLQTLEIQRQRLEAIKLANDDVLNKEDHMLNELQLKRKKASEKQIRETEKTIQDTNIALQGLDIEASDKASKIFEDATKRISDLFNNLIKILSERMQKMFDQQINNENRLIDASKRREDAFMQASALSNQQATDSVVTEQKRQEEAIRNIRDIEKKKMNTQFFASILQTYNSKLASGDKNALASTITDATVLKAFLSGLPSFDVGSEYLTSNQNIDGKGGFLAVNHEGERILTEKQNSLVGNIPNQDLANLAYSYRKGNLVNASEVAYQNTNAINLIQHSLNEIKQGFDNITSVNIDTEVLADNILKVTTSKIKGKATLTRHNIIKR